MKNLRPRLNPAENSCNPPSSRRSTAKGKLLIKMGKLMAKVSLLTLDQKPREELAKVKPSRSKTSSRTTQHPFQTSITTSVETDLKNTVSILDLIGSTNYNFDFLFRIINESVQYLRLILQPCLLGPVWWTFCSQDEYLSNRHKTGATNSRNRRKSNVFTNPEFDSDIEIAKGKESLSNDCVRHPFQPSPC